MPVCVAFLRAVNVGGRTVRMETLRAAFEAQGHRRVSTFIASGNVIFETRVRDLAALERRIEADLLAAFGFEVDTFVRRADELAAIAAHEAFDAASREAAQTHVIGFLRDAPDDAARAALAGLAGEADRLALHGRELHWLGRLKQSESTFTNALFEKTLRTRSTFRSVTTVRKVAALAGG